MKITLFTILFSLFAVPVFSQEYGTNVDFTLNPTLIGSKEIQAAFQWVTPKEFRKTKLNLMDLPQMNTLHPNNNQMIVSKLSFITSRSFDSLSYKEMNKGSYVSEMLNSISISQKTADTYRVTNQVKAYSIPVNVSFDFRFTEVSPSALSKELTQYLRSEVASFSTTKRERFYALDMTNFTQLMYRNYSIVYMRELSTNETLIVSGVITSFNLDKANTYFNYPPLSTTKGAMMKNLKNQILHMTHIIQDN